MEIPKFSIVIPTYNSEKYILKLFRSLKDLTHSEIIIVDDGSADATLQEVSKYQKLLSESCTLKVYTSPHSGPSVARNIGLSHITGTYVMFVDSDDTIDSHYLESIPLSEYRGDIISFNDTVHHEQSLKDETQRIELIKRMIVHSGCEEYQAGPWNKLYKSSLILKNKILFNPSIYRGEDLLFNIKTISYARIIDFVSPSFYRIFLSENSITRRFDDGRLDNSLNFIKAAFSTFNEITQSPLQTISSKDTNLLYAILVESSYENDLSYALRHSLPIREIFSYSEKVKSRYGQYFDNLGRGKITLKFVEATMVKSNLYLLVAGYMQATKVALMSKRALVKIKGWGRRKS